MLKDGASGAGTREHFGFRTTCGREVRVGRLALAGAQRAAWRISLDIGVSPGQDDAAWAGLTPAEARLLAASLLGQAAAAERDAGPDRNGTLDSGGEGRYPGRLKRMRVHGDEAAGPGGRHPAGSRAAGRSPRSCPFSPTTAKCWTGRG
jgi:hypothetical protein